MKLCCKLCSHESIFEGSPGQKGQIALTDNLMRHIAHQHKQSASELAVSIAAASGYLAIRMFGTIPDDEHELRAGLAETERELFAVISGDAIARLREVMMSNPKGGRGGAN